MYIFSVSVILHYTLVLINVQHGQCWDSSDFELFDLVEEVGRNFYEVLGLEQTAAANDIRKAYRRLSIQYHPDKNKEPDAEETFRKIAAIAEVLKNEEKRKKYDLILQTGLPDWRQPVYYYRQVRKMGLWELTIFLFILATLGQYLLAWSVYWEKKYELEEVLISRLRKKDRKPKKSKCNDNEGESVIAEHIRMIPKPRYQDLLPIRLVCFLFHLVKSTPAYYQQWREFSFHRDEPISEEEPDNEEKDKLKKPRKKNKVDIPDYSCIFQPVDAPFSGSNESEDFVDKDVATVTEQDASCQSAQWTERDLTALSKAMKKYPGGTVQRWEKISQALGCSIQEVTVMAKFLKTSSFVKQVPTSLQGVTGISSDGIRKDVEENVKKTVTTDDYLSNTENKQITKQLDGMSTPKDNSCLQEKQSHTVEDTWSQHQQRALELALQQFHKGIEDRWDRIANCVPGKTKEDCMIRYKVLVEIVKRKRLATAS